MFLGFRHSSSSASQQYTLPVGFTATMCVCSVNTCLVRVRTRAVASVHRLPAKLAQQGLSPPHRYRPHCPVS